MTESTIIWGISGIFSVRSFFVFVLGTTDLRAYSFPFPYYYQSGDDIILDCRVPSNYMFQFWTLPSSENISTSSGQHHIMTVASTVTLSITNSSSSDDGTYACNAGKISLPVIACL